MWGRAGQGTETLKDVWTHSAPSAPPLSLRANAQHLFLVFTPVRAAYARQTLGGVLCPRDTYTVPMIAAEQGQRGAPGTVGQAGGHKLLQPVVSGLVWEPNRRVSGSQRQAIFLVVREYLPTRGASGTQGWTLSSCQAILIPKIPRLSPISFIPKGRNRRDKAGQENGDGG